MERTSKRGLWRQMLVAVVAISALGMFAGCSDDSGKTVREPTPSDYEYLLDGEGKGPLGKNAQFDRVGLEVRYDDRTGEYYISGDRASRDAWETFIKAIVEKMYKPYLRSRSNQSPWLGRLADMYDNSGAFPMLGQGNYGSLNEDMFNRPQGGGSFGPQFGGQMGGQYGLASDGGAEGAFDYYYGGIGNYGFGGGYTQSHWAYYYSQYVNPYYGFGYYGGCGNGIGGGIGGCGGIGGASYSSSSYYSYSSFNSYGGAYYPWGGYGNNFPWANYGW